jgi:hypothetical protein
MIEGEAFPNRLLSHRRYNLHRAEIEVCDTQRDVRVN